MAVCRFPFITTSRDIAPCGQCPECLINRKQLWTNRNILESYAHAKTSFVTLTYADEHLPKNNNDIPTLVKKDLQQFIKRLRSKHGGKIRYYAVGEYGTAGERGINPHYHLLLYGINQESSSLVQESWRQSIGRKKTGDYLGHTLTAELNQQSIAYVVGYVEKKNKKNKDMYDELKILPEFSCMSLKPTIGYLAVEKLVDLFKKNPNFLTEHGDVPYSILHGSRSLPLGQYLREKIREGLELPHTLVEYMNENTGEITEKKKWHGKEKQKSIKNIEMQVLQNCPELDKKLPDDAKVSIKHFYNYTHDQAHKNFDAQQRLKVNKKTL